jgi:CubicO group peptidase (beta-lactamase class C family)
VSRRHFVGVIFALLLPAGCAHGTPAVTEHQQGVDPRLAGNLQTILDKERELFAASGASAAVVIPDEGLWTRASGIADPKRGEPVTTRTVFALGSVSKTFTGALVLKLAEEGLLHLDDPLARWLPHFPRANEITIRELLNHTSGVYDVTEDPLLSGSAVQTPARALDGTSDPLLSRPSLVQAGCRLELLEHQLRPFGNGHRESERFERGA